MSALHEAYRNFRQDWLAVLLGKQRGAMYSVPHYYLKNRHLSRGSGKKKRNRAELDISRCGGVSWAWPGSRSRFEKGAPSACLRSVCPLLADRKCLSLERRTRFFFALALDSGRMMGYIEHGEHCRTAALEGALRLGPTMIDPRGRPRFLRTATPTSRKGGKR